MIEDSILDGYNVNREGNVVSTNRAVIHYSKKWIPHSPNIKRIQGIKKMRKYTGLENLKKYSNKKIKVTTKNKSSFTGVYTGFSPSPTPRALTWVSEAALTVRKAPPLRA